MKDLAIFSLELIFFILASLKKFCSNIYSCICLILTIINLKIILKKLLGPGNLLKAQTLSIHKIKEIIMIYQNKNFILAAF